MPAIAEVKFEAEAVSLWAARPADGKSYLRELELSPCTSEEPHRCLLRRTFDLPSGLDPKGAIANLIDGIEPAAWPEKVAVRLFDFLGPIAEVDGSDAEQGLLSLQSPSPLWPEIRDSAAGSRVGLIRLRQLERLIVPVLALRKSGARLEWAPRSREWVLLPELALGAPEPDEWPS